MNEICTYITSMLYVVILQFTKANGISGCDLVTVYIEGVPFRHLKKGSRMEMA